MKFIFIALALFVAGCDKQAPSSAHGRPLAFVDSRVGANGKVELYVQFPNGETQVIAAETRP